MIYLRPDVIVPSIRGTNVLGVLDHKLACNSGLGLYQTVRAILLSTNLCDQNQIECFWYNDNRYHCGRLPLDSILDFHCGRCV